MTNPSLLRLEPDISFIIPAYNSELTIGACLDSILALSVEKEIIVILDDPQDKTPSIVETYRREHDCIFVVSLPHRGSGFARNEGIRMARGRYLFFVDSDDHVVQTDFKELIDLMDRENLTMLRGEFYLEDSYRGEVTRSQVNQVFYQLEENTCFLTNTLSFLEKLVSYWSPAMWCHIYRRSFIQEEKIFFSELSLVDDILFLLDAYLKGVHKKLGVISRPLYSYSWDGSWDRHMSSHWKHLTGHIPIIQQVLYRGELYKNELEKEDQSVLDYCIRGVVVNLLSHVIQNMLNRLGKAKGWEVLEAELGDRWLQFYETWASTYLPKELIIHK